MKIFHESKFSARLNLLKSLLGIETADGTRAAYWIECLNLLKSLLGIETFLESLAPTTATLV